jgi:hypothetical protein
MTNKLKIFITSSLIIVLTISFVFTLNVNKSYAIAGSDTTKFINEKRVYIKQFVKQQHIEGLSIAFFTNNKVIWKE